MHMARKVRQGVSAQTESLSIQRRKALVALVTVLQFLPLILISRDLVLLSDFLRSGGSAGKGGDHHHTIYACDMCERHVQSTASRLQCAPKKSMRLDVLILKDTHPIPPPQQCTMKGQLARCAEGLHHPQPLCGARPRPEQHACCCATVTTTSTPPPLATGAVQLDIPCSKCSNRTFIEYNSYFTLYWY